MSERQPRVDQERGPQRDQELLVEVETASADSAGVAMHRVRPWQDRDEAVVGAPVFLSAEELATLVETGQLELTVEQVPPDIETDA